MERNMTFDAVVVGGGLAGLTAALILARGGQRVQLLEQASALGGRAQTEMEADFAFNRGPHAIYRDGEARAILRDLGIPYSGHKLPAAADGLRGEVMGPLPAGPVTFWTTPFLSNSGRREFVRLVARLLPADPSRWDGVTLADWLAAEIKDPQLRQVVETLCRVSSYSNDPARASAGAMLLQLQRALRGSVEYLDGGWQTLVAGLESASRAAGVNIRTGERVAGVAPVDGGWQVTTNAGPVVVATDAVLAVGPRVAARLVSGPAQAHLAAWANAAVPMRAACLNVGLRTLPHPERRVVLGLDAPVYYSVHSAVARLAPAGGAMIHLVRYLAPGEEGAAARAGLEALLDRVQPGWRAVCLAQQFLPEMHVSEALVTAAGGGRAGRHGPSVPGAPGLYVAGDWVGGTGLLSDAALASAQQAARAILAAGSQGASQRDAALAAA